MPKPHRTVYYTASIKAYKPLKFILIPAATISSKAKEARSNRAGQAKQNKAPAKNLIFFDDRTGLQPQSSLQIVW